jgi:hypothetical protein
MTCLVEAAGCSEGRFAQWIYLRAQVGGHSQCGWLTAGGRGSSPVLAGIWHAPLSPPFRADLIPRLKGAATLSLAKDL